MRKSFSLISIVRYGREDVLNVVKVAKMGLMPIVNASSKTKP